MTALAWSLAGSLTDSILVFMCGRSGIIHTCEGRGAYSLEGIDMKQVETNSVDSTENLLPAEDYDAFMREMFEADTNPDYDPEVPLVAGGYIDDQSKWHDGTGEWLLYALGLVSGGVITWLIIYAVGRFLL